MILKYNFNLLEYILKSSLHPVDYHYSQILHLSVHLLAKIYLYPQNNACRVFMVTHRHGQRGWKLELAPSMFPLVKSKDMLCLLVSAIRLWARVLSAVYLVSRFPHFCFLLVILFFKMPPTPAWCCTLIFNLIQNADLLYQFLTSTDIFTTKHTGAFDEAEIIVS